MRAVETKVELNAKASGGEDNVEKKTSRNKKIKYILTHQEKGKKFTLEKKQNLMTLLLLQFYTLKYHRLDYLLV